VANANELQIAIENILQNKIEEINKITVAGNAVSNQQLQVGAGLNYGGWVNTSNGSSNNNGGGGGDECRISNTVQTIDTFTKERRVTSSCGGSFSKFYETGAELKSNVLNDFLSTFDWQELFEAIEWIDLNVESKNRQVLENALSGSDDYNNFFTEQNFNGYEVVQIIGDGSSEKGMELAFLPEDFDPDFEFLEARGEEAAFVFEEADNSEDFLGEDFADTFLNAEEESKCDKIPNTTLTWPLRLACSLKATTTATTKNVSVGANLGTNDPIEPIVEDLEVTLDGKRLVVTPTDIFTSSKAQDLIEINVELQDSAGEIQTGDFSTEVTLEFDSRDAEKFFTVSPSQSLPLVAGKTTFYLVPKNNDVGGKFNMQAVGRNPNNSGKKLSTGLIPVRLGTYRLWGMPESDELRVGDTNGTTVEITVLDIEGVPTRDWEGKELEFKSDGGAFEDYGKAVIENGVARATFLPGTKAGTYDLNITDPASQLPSHTTTITLVPDLAVAVKMTKKSPYIVEGSFYQAISAQLVDKFDNIVDGLPHQWTWETKGLDIQDRAAYDIDPRARGVQMLAEFNELSTLPIRATAGETKAQIGVKSDFLEEGAARGLSFTVIKDPLFNVTLDRSKIQAGSEEVITATVEAQTKEGDLIADDFTLQIGAEPVVKGKLPNRVKMSDGRVQFSFQPGTLAGDFKLRLTYPGFQSSLTPFTAFNR